MKKTLIALMALAGMASADIQDFDTLNFGTGTFATDYSFSFMIEPTDSITDYGSIVAYYGGSNYQSTYGSNVFQIAEVTAEGSTEVTYTLTLGVGTMNGGLTASSDIQKSTGVNYYRNKMFAEVLKTGVVYTVTGANGKDQSIDVTLSWEGGSETITGFNGNMNGNNGTTWSRVNDGYAVVPEPATATLSLLALAGLAVRRRRK